MRTQNEQVNEDMIELMERMSVLAEIFIKYRTGSEYRWYIEQDVQVSSNSHLTSISGNGSTIEEAIEDHWKQLTQLNKNDYIVANACTNASKRVAVRWNKYLWAPVYDRGLYEQSTNV